MSCVSSRRELHTGHFSTRPIEPFRLGSAPAIMENSLSVAAGVSRGLSLVSNQNAWQASHASTSRVRPR
jgi:hypothetical protein